MVFSAQSPGANTVVVLRSVVLVSAWCIAAIVSGSSLLKLMAGCGGRKRFDEYVFEYLLCSFLAGFVLTILSCILLMSTVGLSMITGYCLLGFLFLLGLPSAGHTGRCLFSRSALMLEDFRRHRVLAPAAWSLLLITGILFLLLSLLPPSSTDELGYHVWQPSNGRYFLEKPEPGNIYLWMPRNIETMFFFFRVLAGDFFPSSLFQSVIFFVVAVTIAHYLGLHIGDRTLSLLIAIMCVFSIHAFPRYVPSFLVDSGVHGLIVIFGAMLLVWIRDNANIPALTAAGLAAGLALGSKYHALTYVVCFCLVLLPFICAGVVRKKIVCRRVAGVLLLTALPGCLFWFARNVVCSGNPFYPFLFAHPGLSDSDMILLKQQIARIGTPMSWSYVFAPFISEYKPYRSFFFLPGFVSLGSLCFREYRREVVALSGFLILVVVVTQKLQSIIYPRYSIALFVLGSLLGGYTIGGLLKKSGFMRRTGLLLLLAFVSFNFALSVYAMRPAIAVNNVLGRMPPREMYKPSSLAAFELNSLGKENRCRVVMIEADAFFAFYRPPDADILLRMKEVSQNRAFDDMTDPEILEFFLKKGATHFMTRKNEEFAMDTASRCSLEEFLRIYRVRRVLIESSRPVTLESSRRHELYRLTRITHENK